MSPDWTCPAILEIAVTDLGLVTAAAMDLEMMNLAVRNFGEVKIVEQDPAAGEIVGGAAKMRSLATAGYSRSGTAARDLAAGHTATRDRSVLYKSGEEVVVVVADSTLVEVADRIAAAAEDMLDTALVVECIVVEEPAVDKIVADFVAENIVGDIAEFDFAEDYPVARIVAHSTDLLAWPRNYYCPLPSTMNSVAIAL